MCLISFWRCKGTAIFRTDNEFFAKSSKKARSFDVNQGVVCEHTRFVCENTPFFHLYWQWSERSLLIHTKRITLQILHFRVSGWQNADAQGVCTLFGGWQGWQEGDRMYSTFFRPVRLITAWKVVKSIAQGIALGMRNVWQPPCKGKSSTEEPLDLRALA